VAATHPSRPGEASTAGGETHSALEGLFSELLDLGVRDSVSLIIVVLNARVLSNSSRHGEDTSRRGTRAATAAVTWNLLTKQEQVVALLVGQAMTNRQIASRLYLSPHTVNYHLRQIFRKLGITSRVDLAKLANDYLAERT
jgi:DNA-binding NarL/FixJ family response regulator